MSEKRVEGRFDWATRNRLDLFSSTTRAKLRFEYFRYSRAEMFIRKGGEEKWNSNNLI